MPLCDHRQTRTPILMADPSSAAAAASSANAVASVPSSAPPVVVPESFHSVLHSCHQFDVMCAQLHRIDQAQLAQHVRTVRAQPPAAVLDKLYTLEHWVLEMGQEEAREMQRGRQLDVFGPIPPAVQIILDSAKQQHQQQQQRAQQQADTQQQTEEQRQHSQHMQTQ